MSPARPSSSPDQYWETHFAAVADHERLMYLRQEARAQVLAGVCGSLAGGATAFLSAIGWWRDAGRIAFGTMSIALLVTLVAAGIFWLTLTPLEGRRFRRRSLAAALYRFFDRARSVGTVGALLPDGLSNGLSDEAAGFPTDRRLAPRLSEEVREAAVADGLAEKDAAHSPAARERVAAWLDATTRTDLRWWLAGSPEEPLDRHVVEARFRMVFWMWANRQAVEVKAEMIRAGLGTVLLAVTLMASAVLIHTLGGWFLAVVGVAVVAWVALRLLSRQLS